MSNPTPVEKFRPVLTAAQIKHIGKLCRADSSQESLSVLAVMALYEYKINQGVLSPAYSEQPKQSLESVLGFEEATNPSALKPDPQYDESLYATWLEHPESLTIEQLKRVQFYRYNNGKMTPDQERAYESETLGV